MFTGAQNVQQALITTLLDHGFRGTRIKKTVCCKAHQSSHVRFDPTYQPYLTGEAEMLSAFRTNWLILEKYAEFRESPQRLAPSLGVPDTSLSVRARDSQLLSLSILDIDKSRYAQYLRSRALHIRVPPQPVFSSWK